MGRWKGTPPLLFGSSIAFGNAASTVPMEEFAAYTML
jgi:hypothetical protein